MAYILIVDDDEDFADDWIPVTYFVAKPVDLDVLKERVNALLASAA